MGIGRGSGDDGNPCRGIYGFLETGGKPNNDFPVLKKSQDILSGFPSSADLPSIHTCQKRRCFTSTYAGKLISYLGQRTFETKYILCTTMKDVFMLWDNRYRGFKNSFPGGRIAVPQHRFR